MVCSCVYVCRTGNAVHAHANLRRSFDPASPHASPPQHAAGPVTHQSAAAAAEAAATAAAGGGAASPGTEASVSPARVGRATESGAGARPASAWAYDAEGGMEGEDWIGIGENGEFGGELMPREDEDLSLIHI